MIGNLLRAEREKQKLAISDIEKGTSIRAAYIEAIEKGEYDVLPGEAYAKGFIRNYANFLNMDANALVQQYNEERNSSPAVASEEKKEDHAPAAAHDEEQAEKQPLFHSGDDFRERVEGSQRSQKLIIGLVMVIAILGGAWAFIGDGDDPSSAAQKQPAVSDRTRTETVEPAPTPEPTDAPVAAPSPEPTRPTTPSAPTPEQKVADNVDISAQFSDRCWTEVVVDGTIVFEGTIEKGKTMSWSGKDKVSLRLGNAGAADITYNGQNLGKAGDIGAVVEKSFTREKEINVAGY